MTLNTEVHKPDHLVTADQLSVSSPRMRPRLGTTVGKGYVKSQISLPVTTRINQTRDQSCTTHPKINLQHVTQRRRERIVDWPQFRLRRKITGSLTFDTDCGSADTKSELSATRQPIRALHSGVLFNSTTCSVDHIGPVAKVTEQTTAWLQVANVPSTLNAVSPVTNAHGRRGISTNPLVRRRFSADGMPIHRDAEDTIAPSPAKRIYLVPGSTTMQHGNAV
ncbi:hypothetical protein FBUS_07610 [Fasciolopsis buskii]|uniref:Uncharacterized protein n=1 Tax=Fasciolopsis buskii TaxID=27845 RepID=A0A8E0RUI9_9TREM|nr:hypothetical protein FBUS_07610 [Fasciolopsis buski]